MAESRCHLFVNYAMRHDICSPLRTYPVKSMTIQLIIITKSQVLRTNKVILRTNPVILMTNSILFGGNKYEVHD